MELIEGFELVINIPNFGRKNTADLLFMSATQKQRLDDLLMSGAPIAEMSSQRNRMHNIARALSKREICLE